MTEANQIPHGLGIEIPPSIEQYAASSYIWRAFSQPDYWIDGGFGRIGEASYVPMLAYGEWDDTAKFVAQARGTTKEFWLVGQEAQHRSHPTEVANFSHEWHENTKFTSALPGVRLDAHGLQWLDAYLDVGGRVPEAWHIHLAAPWPEWKKRYEVFLLWMRKRQALRPVVVTGVEAGTIHRPAHSDFAKRMVSEGLNRLNFLSALIWSSVYDPHRWGASMVRPSMSLSALGREWVRSQKEWDDALTGDSPKPAWNLLGHGDRDHHARTLRRRAIRDRDRTTDHASDGG